MRKLLYVTLVAMALMYGQVVLAAARTIASVQVQAGQLNWLGTDIPAGQLTFSLSADSANILMTDQNGTVYPYLVRDPSDPPVSSSVGEPDTLQIRRDQLASRELTNGQSLEAVALIVGTYLRRSAQVQTVQVDGAWVTYTLVGDPITHQYRPSIVRLPSRAAQLTSFIQPTIDALQRGQVVLLSWSGRRSTYDAVKGAQVRAAIAALRRGQPVSSRIVNAEVAQLIRRPVDRQTLRQMREE